MTTISETDLLNVTGGGACTPYKDAVARVQAVRSQRAWYDPRRVIDSAQVAATLAAAAGCNFRNDR